MSAGRCWRCTLALTSAMVLAAALPRSAGAQSRKLRAAFHRADSARAVTRDQSRYDDYFKKYSKRYFGAPFDWRFFKAQGMAESELNANAKSFVGARGVMQLMPSTFALIASRRPEFRSIDDPEFNIAAGIMHDRWLWTVWQKRTPDEERHRFMFGSYNAGEGPILRACIAARGDHLSDAEWASIERVAPKIDRWRYRETLGYVRKIDRNYSALRKTR
jgi:soluble lytic murein transglycosylase-like protein